MPSTTFNDYSFCIKHIYNYSLDHNCKCDFCVELNKRDLQLLELIRKYLNNEVNLEQFRSNQVEVTVSFPYAISSPCSLADAVEFILADLDCNNNFSEDKFKLILENLIYGYEIRMRTIHKWEKVEKEDKG